jgi:hypothetical protein
VAERDFNLFLLAVCLFALPFYLLGALLELLFAGPVLPPKTFGRSSIRPSPVSVCPCCGSILRSEKSRRKEKEE